MLGHPSFKSPQKCIIFLYIFVRKYFKPKIKLKFKKTKKVKKEGLKYSFSTIEHYPAKKHCHYSGLPSPAAYEKDDEEIDR